MTAEDLARRMAQPIMAEWSVGEFSRFCDDAPEFDSADEKDVAAKLLPYAQALLGMLEALRRMDCDRHIGPGLHCPCSEAWRDALIKPALAAADALLGPLDGGGK